MAMLLVSHPVALELGPVGKGIGAITLSFTVDQVTFVDIPVCMDELALAGHFVINPLSRVARSIESDMIAMAIAHSVLPCAFICLSILHLELLFMDTAVLISLL